MHSHAHVVAICRFNRARRVESMGVCVFFLHEMQTVPERETSVRQLTRVRTQLTGGPTDDATGKEAVRYIARFPPPFTPSLPGPASQS